MDTFDVLFVDDEIDFLDTLMKRMKKRNVSVFGVNCGEDAIEYLKFHSTDVVVLDMRMPGMDGIETLREIKKLDPMLEVIMLTGHACLEAAQEGMELGAFDYLMKPINIDELLYKLQDAYRRKFIHEEKIRQLKETMALQKLKEKAGG
ncbi:MAG: response regulator [Desulfatirhabdiaceae bacterium]